MFLKSFLLRFLQVVLAVSAVYLLLMAGTHHLQYDSEAALVYVLFAAGLGCGALIFHMFIRQFDPELTLEVGRLVYPAGMLVSIGGAVLSSQYVIAGFPDVSRVYYSFILAACLLVAFFVFRMFDLKWLRSWREIHFHQARRENNG